MGTMSHSYLVLLLGLSTLICIGGQRWPSTYFVAVPRVYRTGTELDVYVHILQATGPVNVRVELVDSSDNMVVVDGTTTLDPGEAATVSLQVPSDISDFSHNVVVSGTGGLDFIDELSLCFDWNNATILLQTDKGIYKPGQRVLYRAVALYPNLQTYDGRMHVLIEDPMHNKILDADVDTMDGILDGQMQLSNELITGIWRITVSIGRITGTKTFTVENYDLPEFEISIELPAYLTATQNQVDDTETMVVKVVAKYTYGEPVQGTVQISTSRSNRDVWVSREETLVNGAFTFSASYPSYYQARIAVIANVTEEVSGITLSKEEFVQSYRYPVKIAFLGSSPSVFKPGLTYIGFVQLTEQDGTAVQGAVVLTVQTKRDFESAQLCTSGAYATDFSWSSIDVTMVTDSTGVGMFSIDVPLDADDMSLKACYDPNICAFKSLEPAESPSYTFLQIILMTVSPKADQSTDFELRTTLSPSSMAYLVLAKGGIVVSGSFDTSTPTSSAGGQNVYDVSLMMTSDMAPSAQLLVYFISGNEVIADLTGFTVEGALTNDITISFDEPKVTPGTVLNLVINADPNSLVATSVVDSSLAMLSSGNDITLNEVIGALRSFSLERRNHFYPCWYCFWRPWYYFPGNSQDTWSVFNDAGIKLLTDSRVFKRRDNSNDCWGRFARSICIPQTSGARAPESDELTESAPDQQQQAARIRDRFPETWLWQLVGVGASGSASVAVTAPDTITRWNGRAFGVNPVSGFGVTEDIAELIVFMPLFIRLEYPSAVTRDEVVNLQVIVFNHMDTAQTVTVTVLASTDYEVLDIGPGGSITQIIGDATEDLRVEPDEAGSVNFPIRFTTLGDVTITVTADAEGTTKRAAQPADAVRRTVTVEAEGVPQEKAASVIADITAPETFSHTFTLTIPNPIVDDTQKTYARVIGDVLGGPLNGLENLLKLPMGCGEQSLSKFAPDIFVTRYLEIVGQLAAKPDLRASAIHFMEIGYQKLLTLKNDDGSFSYYSYYSRGSTWLTAFVVKILKYAKDYIFVEPIIIRRAEELLLSRQILSGKFQGDFWEYGQDFWRRNHNRGGTLTAFVMIALLERNDPNADLTDAKMLAAEYLTAKLAASPNNYEWAISAYALSLCGELPANSGLSWGIISRTLWRKADTYKDANRVRFRYWNVDQSYNWYYRPWASTVETTAYATLYFLQRNKMGRAIQSIRWLASNQNSGGGYRSTQDTVQAVLALAEYSIAVWSDDPTDLTVTITADSTPEFTKTVSIDDTNKFDVQTCAIPDDTSEIDVDVVGTGIIIIQVICEYNILVPEDPLKFRLTLDVTEDTLWEYTLNICVMYLGANEFTTPMAVLEVGFPTSFWPTAESLTSVRDHGDVDRVDVSYRKIYVYLDEIRLQPGPPSRDDICIEMTVRRYGCVWHIRPAQVSVYEYYEPDNAATQSYTIPAFDGAHICDTCYHWYHWRCNGRWP